MFGKHSLEYSADNNIEAPTKQTKRGFARFDRMTGARLLELVRFSLPSLTVMHQPKTNTATNQILTKIQSQQPPPPPEPPKTLKQLNLSRKTWEHLGTQSSRVKMSRR